MQNEPIRVTLLVVDALESLGVQYFIAGSLASSVHGVVRTTMDVDLVADLSMEHVEPLVRRLEDAFYADDAMIRDAIRHDDSFSVIHLGTMFKVDVFVRNRRPFDRAQFERRALHMLVGEPERAAYVASAEDTDLAKLEWYRMGGEISDRQWTGVQGVLKVQGGRLDLGYLRHWAAPLGMSGLLERALGEAPLGGPK